MKVNHICKECDATEAGNWMKKCAKELEERQLCFSCNHWYGLFLKKSSSKVARIDGSHYVIGPKRDIPSNCKGFGGRKFKIKFTDGREEVTDNLWHQGTIPERWRDRMPDNAQFIKERGWE